MLCCFVLSGKFPNHSISAAILTFMFMHRSERVGFFSQAHHTLPELGQLVGSIMQFSES